MPVTFPKRYLNNFIDKHFQDMLFPLDAMMCTLLIPKYNSQDGFVTPINRVQKFKSLLMNCVLVTCIFLRLNYSIVYEYEHMTHAIIIVIISSYIDAVYFSVSITCFCVANIMNTNNNANLVLNLQKASRTFQFVTKDFKRLTYWNWVSTIAIPVYFSFFLIISYLYTSNFTHSLLNLVQFMYFDVSVMYVTRVIWIMKEELKMWVKEMQRCAGILQPLKGYVPRDHKLLESYCFILDAFDLFKKVSPLPIALQIMEVTSHAVAYLQLKIVLKQEEAAEITVAEFLAQPLTALLNIWICKNYLLVCHLCYSVEKFYSQVRQTEEICDAALKLDIPDAIRHLCKNIRRCNKARFDYLRVCGVRVNASLPILIVGALTSYSAVVLQFNLNSHL